MKALSLRQPWAWAVLNAGKRIENRVWGSDFRGPFLIHAAKACGKQEYEDAAGAIEDASNPAVIVPPLEQLARGGIVGRARIVGVLPPRRPDQRDAFDPDLAAARAQGLALDVDACRWHFPEQFVLVDVEPLPFIPLRGMLGFFDVPDAVLAGAVS